MPFFEYEGLDAKRKKVSGEIEAKDVQDAIKKLKKQKIQTTKKPKILNIQSGDMEVKKSLLNIKFGSGVKRKQIQEFFSQFAVLVDAGLPIVRAIKVLEGMLKKCAFKSILGQIREDVQSGSSLSEAMAKHPRVFERLHINMIKAGEAGGILDTILSRISSFIEKSAKLKKRVIGALIYPTVVILLATGIIIAIMAFVVPKFQKTFEDLGQGLPALTQLLMTISNMIKNTWFLFPLGIAGIIFFVKILGINEKGQKFIDTIKLKIPLFGSILKKSLIAKMTRTLGTLLTSGVPILEALNVTKNTIGNLVLSDAIQKVHDSIREGESIVGPLADTYVFDDLVVNMIAVGEETGELDQMLIKVANKYDDDVDTAVSALMSILEPMIIIVLAGVVGFIVICLFQPLLAILQNLGKH